MSVPDWITAVGSLAALLIALGVIWTKLLRPSVRVIAAAERGVPAMARFIEVFGDAPDHLDVLDEIAAQFKTDHGSSLRDVVNTLEQLAHANEMTSKALAHAVAQLEKAANENHSAIGVLKVNLGAIQLLDKEQREEQREALSRLTILLDRVTVKVDALTGTGRRIEAAAAVVADDLAQSHLRADAVDGEPGAAADAASQSADSEPKET